MSGSTIAKVMKFELFYREGGGEFHEMQKLLWELQRQTREVLNKSVQIYYQWKWKKQQHFEETGQSLDIYTELHYHRISSYAYNVLKEKYSSFYKANLSSTIKTACDKCESSEKDILCGTMSVPSYKRDQPLLLHDTSLSIRRNGTQWFADCKLFSAELVKNLGLKRGQSLVFSIKALDKTQINILERIEDGNYAIRQSQLTYEKKKWFLYLTYRFDKPKSELDPNRILGVDLGVSNAFCASVYGELDKLMIPGDEAIETIRRLEQIKYSKLKQARYCGEGRIGHGTSTRIAPAYSTRDKISNLQKTLNHRWSHAIVRYAPRQGCGVIQMEDLSGIKEANDFPLRLQHWTYYDLQTKTKNKANEYGIEVRQVDPQFTSQRCSKCGCIQKENRPAQAKFCCVKCGYKANADYNASQNLALPDIDRIIQEELKQIGANCK